MRVFITGSGGLVGRNIKEKLEISYEVLAPRRNELDLSNYDAVNQYILKTKPDLIIHCAGLVGGIAANIKNPVNFLVENLDVGRNVILSAYRNDIKKLINLGSSCMYPRNAENPLKEDMILTGELEPTNEGYALAKIACQRLCQYIMAENPNFMYKTLIPCNLYGTYDKFDPVKSHMIPAIIMKIHDAVVNSKDIVEIWGDGTARREFMHVDDLTNFMNFAIDNYDLIPDLINVGLGYDYSVTDYYNAAAKVIGYSGEFKYDTTKPAGMKQKLVDVSLASELGWKANITLEDGIKLTYDYYKQLGDLK